MVHRLEMHYTKEDITRTNHDIHCLFTVAHFSKRKLKQKQKKSWKDKVADNRMGQNVFYEETYFQIGIYNIDFLVIRQNDVADY